MTKSLITILILVAIFIGIFLYDNSRLPRPLQTTSVEIVIPDAPTASSTQESRMKYVEYLASISVEGTRIDITDCQAMIPRVLKTSLESQILFTNNGDQAISAQMPPFAAFSVPPKGEREIPANVVKTGGIWPITCGQMERAGFIYIP